MEVGRCYCGNEAYYNEFCSEHKEAEHMTVFQNGRKRLHCEISLCSKKG